MENQFEFQPNSTVTNPIASKKSKWPFILTCLLIVILVAGLVGVYLWQHKKVENLSGQLTSAKARTAATSGKQQSTANNPSTKPVTETDILPNGTKVSYPLTTANANVVWWSGGNDVLASSNVPPDGYMRVTDKHVIEFLSTLPSDAIQNLCSSDWNDETAFQMGLYDTTKKTLTLHNQYQNCIDAVANDKGGQYASSAQQVLAEATSDLNAWANSLTVTAK